MRHPNYAKQYSSAYKNFLAERHELDMAILNARQNSLTHILGGQKCNKLDLRDYGLEQTAAYKARDEAIQVLHEMQATKQKIDASQLNSAAKQLEQYTADLERFSTVLSTIKDDSAITKSYGYIQEILNNLNKDKKSILTKLRTNKGFQLTAEGSTHYSISELYAEHINLWSRLLGFVMESATKELITNQLPEQVKSKLVLSVIGGDLKKSFYADNTTMTIRSDLEATAGKEKMSIRAGNMLIDALLHYGTGEIDMSSTLGISIKSKIGQSSSSIKVATWDPMRVAIAAGQKSNGDDITPFAIYRALGAQEHSKQLRSQLIVLLGLEAVFGSGVDQITDLVVNNYMYSADYVLTKILEARSPIKMTIPKHKPTKDTDPQGIKHPEIRKTEAESVKWYLPKLNMNSILFSLDQGIL